MSVVQRFEVTWVMCALVAVVWGAMWCHAEEFRAGASAVDVSPPNYPVRVNGMFTERSATQAVDPLYARAFALDDSKTQIIFCVVDTCMMPRELIDEAKAIASAELGVATDQMMVSATHTHSAPAAMGCLGSRMDPAYAAWLPEKVAEAIVGASRDLQPARIGWASVDDWAHSHNRRWIRRADRIFEDPFGEATVRAHMHPGYESGDVIGPSGPVDPGLSVVAAQTKDGVPLALMANYSQHYFGSPLLSADYFGMFSRNMANHLDQPSSEGPFVAMMSQGTSGDLMWMDYGAPQTTISLETYSDEMAAMAMKAYEKIEWHGHVPLGIVEKKLRLNYRVPDDARLAWAQARLEALGDALPKVQPDIYAHEALILHERQSTEVVLQSIRIGGLSIATLPNEVYALTGLKLKAQSPFDLHFNIELANGADGYIPPPEQFVLGGYTTWPARTAGLEVNAEPQIVESLLAGLEEVGGTPRRAIRDAHGPYAAAVLAAKPVGYWRLNDMAGRVVRNAVSNGVEGRLSGGAALYLPGAGSGSGNGAEEALHVSNFSGPTQINRAVHFADGAMDVDIALNGPASTVALWFWLGERSGASERAGELVTMTNGESLEYAMEANGISRLSYRGVESQHGSKLLSLGEWHFVCVTRDGESVCVYVNGEAQPDIEARGAAGALASLRFGDGLEGKLDEIAVFDRLLDADEIAAFWNSSGIAEERAGR